MAPELKLNMNTLGSTVGGAMGNSLGNNPFGAVGTDFINCIFQGGNFWNTLGQSAANIGMQAGAMAMNSVFSAVGGAITGGISVATEKVKNKKKEQEIAENNTGAANAINQGVSEAEKIISEADSKIAKYNTEIEGLQTLISNYQELTAKQEEELQSAITEVQQQIAEYELKQVERHQIEMKMNNTDDEAEKARLQQQYNTMTGELQTLSEGINEIQTNLETIRTNITTYVDETRAANEKALQVQMQEVELTDDVQAALDVTIQEHQQIMAQKLQAGSTAASTLNGQGQQQIQIGTQMSATGGALSCTGVGALFGGKKAADGAALIAEGSSAKANAISGQTGLISTFGSIGTKYEPIITAIGSSNSSLAALETAVQAVSQGSEDFAAYAENLINEIPVYKTPEEREEVQV